MTGRLRPGVTLGEAAAQLDVLADALAAEHPDASAHTELYVIAERYARPEPGAARHTAPLVSVVMGLASLVLLVAMANVGTLLVARGVERRQEMAVRAGLGATRRRLVRQLITESVLLALAGGVGGGIVAVWAADLVVAYFATAVGLESVATRLPRGLAGVRVHCNDGHGGRGAHRTCAGVALDAHRVGARNRLQRPQRRRNRLGAAPDERARRAPGRRFHAVAGLRRPLRPERQKSRRDRLRFSGPTIC